MQFLLIGMYSYILIGIQQRPVYQLYCPAIVASWSELPGSWYQVLGTRYLAPSTLPRVDEPACSPACDERWPWRLINGQGNMHIHTYTYIFMDVL